MIKAEVVLIGNKLNINGFLVIMDGDLWDIYSVDGGYVDSRINHRTSNQILHGELIWKKQQTCKYL